MFAYVVRRIFLMVPTFFGITLVTFLLVNLAPGGPVEQQIQKIRFGQGKGGDKIVSQELINALNKQYGFDRPLLERYGIWLRNLAHLDFGESFTYQEPALDVILGKFPVSLQFGIASFILTYLVCIPLGVFKALKAGKTFDKLTGTILYFSYSVPSLILGIFLIVFFAGSNYLSWFPIGNLQSDDYDSFTTLQKIIDRAHHFVLPLICYMAGGFTELTMVMRNSMLDIINSDYIRTARAKGLPERTVIFKHALKNSLIPMVTGLSGFFAIFVSGSLIVESIFNLDGIGLLAYTSITSRDYNVIMGLTFIISLALMFGKVFSDIAYVLIDPRIDFR